jgi:YrbI family 3-deoxy-D-manno-octulosonate 8-phosphate phosphatase
MKFPTGIDLLVFDFDGVLTDNHVYVDELGRETVRCSRADSLGIARLQARKNIPMLILSTEENPVVGARAAKMNIPAIQSCGDKAAFLKRHAEQKGFALESILYVGNDLNDLEAMRLVGYPVCPSDAHAAIREISRVILSCPGGSGAVRELCDMLLNEPPFPYNPSLNCHEGIE